MYSSSLPSVTHPPPLPLREDVERRFDEWNDYSHSLKDLISEVADDIKRHSKEKRLSAVLRKHLGDKARAMLLTFDEGGYFADEKWSEYRSYFEDPHAIEPFHLDLKLCSIYTVEVASVEIKQTFRSEVGTEQVYFDHIETKSKFINESGLDDELMKKIFTDAYDSEMLKTIQKIDLKGWFEKDLFDKSDEEETKP